MKNRIMLTIVALVILPTALLSIMAGRSVRNRELVVTQQMTLSAQNMLALCSEEIESGVKDELTRIKSSIASVLMRTASESELARAASTMESESDLIGGIVIYHDPWDVIYPSSASSSSSTNGPQPSFINLLRKEIAQSQPGQRKFSVNDNGVYYCFTLIPGRNDLYAGFRSDLIGFRKTLEDVMQRISTDDILLAASGRMYANDDAVIIDDPLSSSPDRQTIAFDTMANSSELLAEGSLGAPFNDVRISAYARDPGQLHITSRNQGRLLGWGIILLSGGILLGVVILIYQIQEEIRRTSARANYIIGISHDLRTPIASLKMMTESLYSGTVKAPEKRHKFLEIMTGECQRLNRLVERVLYFVRFGEDALVFFKKTVDLRSMLLETVQSFTESATGKRAEIKVTTDFAEDLPELEVDDNALSQILLNLLDNALKYGRAEGKNPDITVSAAVCEKRRSIFRPSRTFVKISVSDNGPGIEQADIKKIFKPYFRSKSAPNLNSSGVGLGLALCRHIARAHGGWIEARNGDSAGAVFNIYLPTPE